MTESPQIVTRIRRGEPSLKDFKFTASMVPQESSAALRAFRAQAWETYQKLPMPTTRDEPWRRTDLRGLRMETFRLPEPGAHLDLSPVPEILLRPVADEAHGGQIILLAGGSPGVLEPGAGRTRV